VAAAGQTDWQSLDIDGGLPARHSIWRLAWVAAQRKAGPAPDRSSLLRIAGVTALKLLWDCVAGYLG